MAYNPGVLTHWPWESLGNFKYAVVAPGVVHSIYLYMVKEEERDRNLFYVLVLPYMLWRMLHNQLWITYSRYRTAKGKNLIVDRSIDFEQVDRERNWDDQILLNWLILYAVFWIVEEVGQMPLWRSDGLLHIFILHIGPVEFLYYWFHRALHHHFLYSRYHSHHHSSIVSEPITSVTHPFVEDVAYFVLFSIPLLITLFAGTNSIGAAFLYITWIDFMNNMGHCNFEIIPKWVFTLFPPLKYLMYTPSYHSLHHTHFRTNYSLFVPFYDYIYGTMDESTNSVYETSLKKPEDVPDVVHLTHLTTLESVYHLRLGFASLASKPLMNYKWYLWLMWPLTLWSSLVMTWLHVRTFVLETNTFQQLRSQSWVVPRYKNQYLLKWEREAINKMIKEAILEADNKGTKVVSLGLLNQGELLNRNGEIYVQRNPKLRVKVVDGSSLAVALVLNSIPKATSKVLFRGTLSKVAYSVVSTLCHNGIQVATMKKDEQEKLKKKLAEEDGINLIFTEKSFDQYEVWLVGEDLTEAEQSTASKETLFINFSQFPPKKTRKDCFYLNAPAMLAPKSFGNLHSCENWLPRRVMSASRVAGIVHALEGWNTNECGDELFDKDKVWEASLRHGFRPFLSRTT